MNSSEHSGEGYSGIPTKRIKEGFCQIIQNMEQELDGIRATMREINAIFADNECKMKNLKGQILVFRQMVEKIYPEISGEDTADQPQAETPMFTPEAQDNSTPLTNRMSTPVVSYDFQIKRFSEKVLEESPVKRLKTNAPESGTSAGNQGSLSESTSFHSSTKLRASVSREQKSAQPNANGAEEESFANHISPDGSDIFMDSIQELPEDGITVTPDSATTTTDVNYTSQSATENEVIIVPQEATTFTENISDEEHPTDLAEIQMAANCSWGILTPTELQTFLYLSKERKNPVELAKMSFTQEIKLLYYQLIILKHNFIKAKSEVRRGTSPAIREFDETLEMLITLFEKEVQQEGGNSFPQNP